jgi:hypothetical protein
MRSTTTFQITARLAKCISRWLDPMRYSPVLSYHQSFAILHLDPIMHHGPEPWITLEEQGSWSPVADAAFPV